MFTLKNVCYFDILNYDDIEIPEGQATFICGESGCGKSTLLKLLNGVASPTGGEITYLGKPLDSYDSILLRREILLVGQSVYLFDKTIEENFTEYYAYRNMQPPCSDKIKAFLDICAVDLPQSSMCNVLSGGERQRVFIAISLSFEPKVLMIDEPTSALDEKNANALIENIKAFCAENQITMIAVSHDKSIAERFADNIVMLTEGAKQ